MEDCTGASLSASSNPPIAQPSQTPLYFWIWRGFSLSLSITSSSSRLPLPVFRAFSTRFTPRNLEKPDENATRDDIINNYIKTLVQIVDRCFGLNVAGRHSL